MKRRDASQTLSVAELEEAIAHTRARLSHRLTVLDREYALRHLLVRGMRIVRAAEYRPGNVAEKVRHEILPLTLVGAGLACLVLGRKEGGHLLGRMVDLLTHIQNLAREFLALLSNSQVTPTPPLTDARERGGETAPTTHPRP